MLLRCLKLNIQRLLAAFDGCRSLMSDVMFLQQQTRLNAASCHLQLRLKDVVEKYLKASIWSLKRLVLSTS